MMYVYHFQIASGLNANAAANQHSTTIHVLSMLSCYCWEDKVVLMLAAFSIMYGEFSLVSPSRIRNRKLGLAQKLASLKQSRRPNLKAVVDCMSSVLELSKCVVELGQWLSYSPQQSTILALPMAAYWIATTLVNLSAACACASHAHFK